MLGRLIREPLVHFIVLAAIIFAAYALVAREEPVAEVIEVSQAKMEQLQGLFTKTWQRQPTIEELKGLIDDHVKEEIYVREALRLGLDRDDTVIRRRLRLKMEFLTDAEADAKPPSDAELEAYLAAHAQTFRSPPQIAFEQIYVNAEKRGADAGTVAQSLLVSLRNGETDPATAGDPTLLPASLPLIDQPGIAQIFGDDFAHAVAGLEPGAWQGPVTSALGLHLVRVTAQTPGRLPRLTEIRSQVEREWKNERRQHIERQRFDELLKQYTITIEPLAPAVSSPP
jgi:hypothetical protein